MIRKACMVLILMGVVLFLGATTVVGDEEPNDYRAGAEAISTGGHSGHVTSGTDEHDWYAFSVSPGQTIRIDFSAATATSPVGCSLVDDDTTVGIEEEELRSMANESVSTSLVTARETTCRDWYVHVRCMGETGAYEFELRLVDPDDAGSGEDAPAELSEALEIDPGEHTGHLGGVDTVDTYKLPVRAGWVLDLELTGKGDAPVTLKVLDEDGGDPLATITSEKGGMANCSFEVPQGPTFAFHMYMTLEGDTSEGGEEERQDYTLSVEIDTSSNPPDDTLPVLDTDPSVEGRRGKDVVVTIGATDDNEVARAILHYRAGNEGNWSSVEMTQEGAKWTATVPKDTLGDADVLQYYVEAMDLWGNSGYHGSETSPKSVKLDEEDKEEGPGFGALLASMSIAALAVARRRRPR